MYKFVYRISVRIGFDEFHKEFENERAALDCFNRIALNADDIAIETDHLTLESEAQVDEVTIRQYEVPLDIGNPNRR